jgi:hypothetical protein
MNIYEKIDSGYYTPKSEFFIRKKYDSDEVYYNQPYFKEDLKLYNEFKQDAFNELGLDPSDPMTKRAWDMVWDIGHRYGYSEVFGYLCDIAYVIKGDQ